MNMGSLEGEKICLNIAPKHMTAAQTDLEDSFIEQRDIPAMKCRQWTNLEMKQYQKQGYLMPYDKDPDVVLTEEETVGDQMYRAGPESIFIPAVICLPEIRRAKDGYSEQQMTGL